MFQRSFSLHIQRLSIAFVCCFFTAVGSMEAAKVEFYKGNPFSAKTRAKAEGKLYFYDFVASWCTPCRWMDEATYTNEELADYINANYVACKVDIDDFDGFSLKDQYAVKVLPTVIIFNQAGKIVYRAEESLSASKMLEILKTYATPSNGIGKKVSSPATPVTKPDGPVTRPALPDTKPAVTPSATPTKPAKTNTATYSTVTSLYKVDISRQPTKGFSLQVGSYGMYDNVVKAIEEYKQKYNLPVIMRVENTGGTISYKLLIGEFKTKEDAIKYQKAKIPTGYVRDLAAWK
jgi:thiol-disulfide isomerase/thioredoxin